MKLISRRETLALGAALAASSVLPLALQAAEETTTPEQAALKGIEYLRTKGQADDGSYTAPTGPAVTAIATAAVLRHGRSVQDPQVAKALKYLQTFVQPDGGIYQANSNWRNYETCISIVAFTQANKDGKYKELIANAEKFVKGLQWDEDEDQDRASPNYGGAGYGKSKRPDLSNTVFLLDALQSIGTSPSDPAVQKALVFVSRCQNLETEHNTTPFPAKNPDGGFYYTPAAGGNSQAGMTDNGGLRSYASMTYAGLKSMIFAGLGPDDPRVKAATTWLKKNYDLQSNPGMGSAGLYYYYHTFAKALDALGQEEFVDDKGTPHRWRQELAAELIRRQRADGSWANENSRWMEGDANLVTAYALLALAYCKPAAK